MKSSLIVFHIQRSAGWLRNRYLEAKARFTGKAFWCRSLAGMDNYNLSVNSDMTVSCNCQDMDGTGRFGSLRQTPLSEVLLTPRAQALRDKLAAGRLPMVWCANCSSLEVLRKGAAQSMRQTVKNPHTLMIENTATCNLACTSCDRSVVKASREGLPMSFQEMDSLAQQLKDTGVKLVHFFKLGEPFASRLVAHEVDILLEHNPGLEITCSSNGAIMTGAEKQKAALRMKFLQFSIDGISTEMCRRYQENQNFENAYWNMASLVKRRAEAGQTFPIICWKYVLFRWNEKREHIDTAFRMAVDAGVDYLILADSITPPWAIPWRSKLPWSYVRSLGRPTALGRLVRIAAKPEHDSWINSHVEGGKP